MSNYWDIAKTVLTPNIPCSDVWDCAKAIGNQSFFTFISTSGMPQASPLRILTNFACGILYAPFLDLIPQRLYYTGKNIAASVWDTRWLLTQTPNATGAAYNKGKLALQEKTFSGNERLFWDKAATDLTGWERSIFKQLSRGIDTTTMSRWLHYGATFENIASLQHAMHTMGNSWADDQDLIGQMLTKISNINTTAKQRYIGERWNCAPYLERAQQTDAIYDGLHSSDPTTKDIGQHKWSATTGLLGTTYSATLTALTLLYSLRTLVMRKFDSQENYSQMVFKATALDALEMCSAQSANAVAHDTGIFGQVGGWGVWGIEKGLKYFTPIMFGQQLLGELNQGGWQWMATSVHDYMFRAAFHDRYAYTQNQIIPKAATSWLGEASHNFGLFTGSDAATAGLTMLMVPWIAINAYKATQAFFGNKKKEGEVKQSLHSNLPATLMLAGASHQATFLRAGFSFNQSIFNQGPACTVLDLPWSDGVCLSKIPPIKYLHSAWRDHYNRHAVIPYTG